MDAELFKHLVSAVYEINPDAVFRFEKEKLVMRVMDEPHVTILYLEMPKSMFKVYEPADEPIKVSVKDLKGYVAGPLRGNPVIDLSCDLKKDVVLHVGIRGLYGLRKFGTPIVALEEEDKVMDLPKLGLGEVSAKVDAVALKQGVDDAGKVEMFCWLEARRSPDRFVVWTMKEGTFQSSWAELAMDTSLFELSCLADQVRSQYGVEHLLVILKAGLHFSEVVKVEFSRDWSVSVTFELPFNGVLRLWTAPRIEPK